MYFCIQILQSSTSQAVFWGMLASYEIFLSVLKSVLCQGSLRNPKYCPHIGESCMNILKPQASPQKS